MSSSFLLKNIFNPKKSDSALSISIKFLFYFLILTGIILYISAPIFAEESSTDEIILSVSSSPSSLPAFYLQEYSENINLKTTVHRSRNIVVSRLMKNEVDAALLSTNEAAKLYNRGVDVRIAGVHTWGIFYLLSSRDDVKGWNDLKGKTIYIPDRGGPLDIIFQELLKKNEINIAENIEVRRGKMMEISQLMINDMAETAVLREPFVTQTLLKNDKAKLILDLQKEWEAEYNFRIPQSALVFRNDFVEKNPQLVKSLQKEYISAISYLEENRDTAADLGNQFLEFDREVILNSFERLNLKYENINQVKDECEKYFQSLMNYSKETIGGRMPDEEFYLEK